MTLKLFTPLSSAAHRKSKRAPRPGSDKRVEPTRPVRVYSLLLPPTLPRDRR